jgi:zinc transporter 2
LSGSSSKWRQQKQHQDNNIVQGAYLRVLGDLIQSVGVMIASAMIWYNPKWQILDLFCRVLFSVLVLGTTIQMLCNILEVLIESTPQEIDDPTFESGSLGFPGVVVVHELHFWQIFACSPYSSCTTCRY